MIKTISADLRASSSQREWAALDEDRRIEVEETFENRARTEEDRSGGLRKIDYLRGRNRLQIFPKHPLPEDDEIEQSLPSARAVDNSSVAGPSNVSTVRSTERVRARAA